MNLRKFIVRLFVTTALLAVVLAAVVFASARQSRKRFDHIRALTHQPKIFDIREDKDGVRVAFDKPYNMKADYCLPGESINKAVIVTSKLPVAITSGLRMTAFRPPTLLSYRIRNKDGQLLEGTGSARFLLLPELPPITAGIPQREVRIPIAISCPKEPGDYRYTIELVQEGVAWQGDLSPSDHMASSTLLVRTPSADVVGQFGLVWARRLPKDFAVPYATEEDTATIRAAYNMAANTILLALQKATLEGTNYLVSSPGSVYPSIWVRDLASIQMALAHIVTEKRYLYPNWTDFFQTPDSNAGMVFDWVSAEPYNQLVRDQGINDVQVDQGLWMINSVLDVYSMKILPKDWLLKPSSKSGSISRVQKLLLTLVWLDKHRFNQTAGCLANAHVADWGDVGLFGADGPTSTSLPLNQMPQVCSIFIQSLYYQVLTRVRNELPVELLSPEVLAKLDERIAAVRNYAQKNLWNDAGGYFRIHRHLDEFQHNFNEDDIFALGGNVMAIKSGLASSTQAKRILATMVQRQEKYKASTIGAVLLPSYPSGTFQNPIMSAEYTYQNGGQWDWYGTRAAALLYRNNPKLGAAKMVEIAKGVTARGQFSEWYDLTGATAHGSPHYRASAAEFINMIHDTILRRDDAQK